MKTSLGRNPGKAFKLTFHPDSVWNIFPDCKLTPWFYWIKHFNFRVSGVERTTAQTNSQRSFKRLIVKILSFRHFFFLLVTQRKFHSSLCNLWLPLKSWARVPKRTLTKTLMKDIVCRICNNIAFHPSAKPKITFRIFAISSKSLLLAVPHALYREKNTPSSHRWEIQQGFLCILTHSLI